MDSNTILKSSYADLVFDRRNKAYGAYILRVQYPKRLLQALGGICLLTLGIAIMTFYRPAEETGLMSLHDASGIHEITRLPPPEMPLPPEAPMPPPPAAPVIKTESFARLRITPDEQVQPDEQTATIQQLQDAQPGALRIDGAAGGSGQSLPSGTAGGTGNEIVEPAAPPASAVPLQWVAVMPAFDGNVHQYLAAQLRYPALAREAGIEGRVAIRFVVNEDGSISDVTLLRGIGGGCDEEAMRVVRAMPRWKPGLNNGRPARVYLTLPVTFRLQ